MRSGHWEGALAIPGSDIAFAVDIARNSDGALIGTVSGTDVTNEQRGVAGSYSLTLNAAGTELTGTFTQGADKLAVTIRR